MTWKFFGKYRDFGLLLLRAGIGVMFIFHGWPLLMAGPARWVQLGGAMHRLGVSFMPAAWGLAAALSECLGGVLLILGLAFRPACLLLALTMAVAAASVLGRGEGVLAASHAIEDGILFVGLLFIGPGRYSVDRS